MLGEREDVSALTLALIREIQPLFVLKNDLGRFSMSWYYNN